MGQIRGAVEDEPEVRAESVNEDSFGEEELRFLDRKGSLRVGPGDVLADIRRARRMRGRAPETAEG
jgi:hypothetical protein